MTDIPEVTEALERLDAFVGNLRDRACLTCGECAYEGMAHSMDVATCFSGVYADIATLSDAIERLERERDYYEAKNTAHDKEIDTALRLGLQPNDTYSSLLITIATLRTQSEHQAAVVEAAKAVDEALWQYGEMPHLSLRHSLHVALDALGKE